jgi:hypothetical protein
VLHQTPFCSGWFRRTLLSGLPAGNREEGCTFSIDMIPLWRIEANSHVFLLHKVMPMHSIFRFPYYGSSKEGVKRKIPDAVLIANELKQRFPGRSQAKKSE